MNRTNSSRTKVAILAVSLVLSACGGSESSMPSQTIKSMSKWLHRSEKATAIVASDYANSVQELYVAYFGRPADPTGLANFENSLLAAKAPTDIQGLNTAYSTNSQVKALINSFETSAESIALYGNSSTTAFVTSIYQNVLGRAPDNSGLTFWVSAIGNGSLTQGDAAISIMAGALANTTAQGLIDGQLINNRLSAAASFTSQVSSANAVSSYSGGSAAEFARLMLSTVSATTNTSGFLTTVANNVAILARTKVGTIPVQATSYLNAKIGRAPSALPVFVQPAPYTSVSQYSARAFADFEQNGTLSFFEMSFDWDAQNPSEQGLIKFWHINSDGTFTEITNRLIPNAANQVGCLNPRKAIVADFNKDGKPDIFVACTGYDGVLNGVLEPGEMPMMLLSQPDGTYKVSIIQLSHPMMMHSASAADINGDGYPDLIVADDNVAERYNEPTVFVLKNNKDGTFTEDRSQFGFTLNKSVWSIEIADFKNDGNLEVWLSGQDTDHTAFGGLQSSLYAVNGDGTFGTAPIITFPANQQYPTPLDVTIGGNGYVYFNRTDSAYDGFTIEKVDLSTCNSTTCNAGAVIYTGTTDFGTLSSTNPACMGFGGKWIDFFRIVSGKIVTDNSCQSPNVSY